MRFGRQRRIRAAELPSESGRGATRTAEMGDIVDEPTVTSETSDSTQQLLSALGRLQRELAAVSAGKASDLWADECMNHLILAMEVALQDGWAEMVGALADTGRILQSYENAGRSVEAVAFLNDAYELLCSMIGDSIVDGDRSEVAKKWSTRYDDAVDLLETKGIELVSDNDEGDSGDPESNEEDVPFEMPSLDSPSSQTASSEELPTLDELPPLESMLEMGVDAPKTASAGEIATDELADAAGRDPMAADPSTTESDDELLESAIGGAPANPLPEDAESSSLGAEPSRLVVDVMDRICDELARLESEPESDRPDALATIEGGIQALQREAKEHEQASSAALADSMLEVCRRVQENPEVVDERFTDLAFAFCGVYVEAMEGESENAQQWGSECVTLMSSWDMDDSQNASGGGAESDSEPGDENPFELLADTADKLETISDETPAAPPPDASATDAETAGPSVSPADPATAGSGAASTVSTESEELLAKAQQAALSGNTQMAQQLALQAAAAIGEQGVRDVESDLGDAEDRLRICLDEIEAARESVRTCDENLVKADEQVTEGERNLHKAEVKTGKTQKKLDSLEGQVDELNRQIEELEAQRTDQKEKVNNARSQLQQDETAQREKEEELSARQKHVAASRAELEMARQEVKTQQRTATEIEADIVRVREVLHEKQASLKSIQTTLPAMDGASRDEDAAQEKLF